MAIKNALAIKKRNPSTSVTVLYKEMRTYGFKEALYTQAREEGVIFFWTQDINPTLTIYIPSPWLGFVLINLFIAWLFYRAAIRRVARREKQ